MADRRSPLWHLSLLLGAVLSGTAISAALASAIVQHNRGTYDIKESHAPPLEPSRTGARIELPERDLNDRPFPQGRYLFVAMPPCGSCSKYEVTFEQLKAIKIPIVLAVKGVIQGLDSSMRQDSNIFLVSAEGMKGIPTAVTHYQPQAALVQGNVVVQAAESSRHVKEFLGEVSQ